MRDAVSGVSRYLQPNLGAAQRKIHGVIIELRRSFPQLLFRPRLGFLRALHVDIFRALGRVCQNRYLVRQHLGKAPRHSQSTASCRRLWCS